MQTPAPARKDGLLSQGTLGQLLAFLLVGVLNTAFGMAVFAFLILQSVPRGWALLWATVLGVAFNFQTIGRIVFQNHDWRLLGRFGLTYVIVYCVNLALLEWLTVLGFAAIPAQALLLPLVVLVSFSLNKLFVFQR